MDALNRLVLCYLSYGFHLLKYIGTEIPWFLILRFKRKIRGRRKPLENFTSFGIPCMCCRFNMSYLLTLNRLKLITRFLWFQLMLILIKRLLLQIFIDWCEGAYKKAPPCGNSWKGSAICEGETRHYFTVLLPFTVGYYCFLMNISWEWKSSNGLLVYKNLDSSIHQNLQQVKMFLNCFYLLNLQLMYLL